MVGSAISGTFAKRLSMRTQKKIGYGCLVLACASNLLYNSLTAQPEVPWAVLPIAIYTLGISLLMPILTIETMGQFPEMRGLASSLQGFTQMAVFSLISSLLVPHLFHSGLLLAVGQSVVVATGMLVWWWATRRTGTAAKA